MKQKIDVRVTINRDRDRTSALTIAAGMMGVISVMIGGEDKNILTVIGNEVDIVALTRSLIKKLGTATVVSVIPLNNGRFDLEQAAASMRYQGQPNYYANYGRFDLGQAAASMRYEGQPNCCYNPTVLPQYAPPPPPQYYYESLRPYDSSCPIL